MSDKNFSITLWLQTERITDLMMSKLQLDYQTAIRLLLHSEMYRMLEDEDSKLWRFSALFLFMVVAKEIQTGVFEIPEDVL